MWESGCSASVVDAGTLWLLYDVAHQNLLLATSAGFWLELLGELRSQQVPDLRRHDWWPAGSWAATSYGSRLNHLSNVAIVATLVELGLPAVISKIIAVGLLTVVNFSAYRYWVFRD